MARRILAVFLVLSLLNSSFTRLIVYAWFEVNHTYITSRLCENRSRPLSLCNGNCYLQQKIKQVEQGAKNEAGTIEKNWNADALPPDSLILPAPLNGPEISYSRLPAPAVIDCKTDIFWPPDLLSAV